MLAIIKDGTKKKSNTASINSELKNLISMLSEQLDHTKTFITYIPTQNYAGTIPFETFNRAAKLNFTPKLPEIYSKISIHYMSDSENYTIDEYEHVNHAITLVLTDILSQGEKSKKEDLFIDNIHHGLGELYQDPNLFITDYTLLRSAQSDEDCSSLAGLWIETIAQYGHLHTLKKKTEETRDFRNLCIEENDFLTLKELDSQIKIELGYK